MRGWLALDKRSLGLFRISVGLVLILDVVLRFLHFKVHYTNVGFLPLRDYLIQPDLTYRRWSIFYLNDNPTFVFLLLIGFLFTSVCLTVGYKTRLAGWLCLILLLGVYRRNPVLNNSGDIYLPLLMLWGNFLPWGDAFSLDNPREVSSDEAYYSAFPGFCYLIQVANLYWFTAVLRLGPEWQVDYSALYQALHLEALSTPLAPYLLLCGTDFLAAITWATIMLEIFGPVLLFLPSYYFRILGVVFIVSFHLGILSTLFIPVFALACTAGPIGLLPAKFWDSRIGGPLSRFLDRIFSALSEKVGRTTTGIPWTKLPRRLVDLSNKLYPWLTLPLVSLTVFYLWWGIHWPDDRSFLTSTLKSLSLDQRWGMFSPSPVGAMGWEVARARTKSGKEVNLITGLPYSENAEELANAKSLVDYRWRSFRVSIAAEKYAYTGTYLKYLAQQWDLRHPDDPVVSAQYIYLPETYPKHYLLGEQLREVMSEYHK